MDLVLVFFWGASMGSLRLLDIHQSQRRGLAFSIGLFRERAKWLDAVFAGPPSWLKSENVSICTTLATFLDETPYLWLFRAVFLKVFQRILRYQHPLLAQTNCPCEVCAAPCPILCFSRVDWRNCTTTWVDGSSVHGFAPAVNKWDG
jgi:hypothetical protein